MYLTNKYTQWYNNIISNAQARETIVGYSEKHHIIPKSLGGSNQKTNLVNLTAKEHFICHRLLPKMLEGKNRGKMIFALKKLSYSKNGTRHITSRTYSYIHTQSNLHMSQLQTTARRVAVSLRHTGKFVSAETRKKLSEVGKRKIVSAETGRKISLANTGRTQSPEANAKRSLALKGKKKSPEVIAAMSAAQQKRYAKHSSSVL